jgi:amidophosphoribosyltransferase
MDFPSCEELFANQHHGDIEQMCKWLQVDSLGYLSPEGLVEAATRASQTKHSFCRACFTGVYPVPIASHEKTEDKDW